MKKLKVLQVLDEISHNSGVSFVVGNWSLQNDPHIQYDYLVYNKRADGIIKNISSGESQIYIIPKFSLKDHRDYKSRFSALLKTKNYDIVHLHTPVSAIMHLREAKKNGVPVRIMHSHNTRLSDTLIKRIRNRIVITLGLRYANHFVACSSLAGRSLFGSKRMKEVVVFRNAVDVERFKHNAEKRNEIRRRYQLGDAAVILHVGRMSRQKNHKFLLKSFAKVVEKNADAKLVLLGAGPLGKKLKRLCEELSIAGNVQFIGVAKRPEDFMCAADMLVLPSLYEGLPLVALEAQVSGLQCVLSDTITREAKIDDKCTFLSLKDVEEWAAYMLAHMNKERRACENKEALEQASIRHQNVQLCRYYLDVREK